MTDPTTSHYETLLRQQESLRAVIESISSELELRPLLTRIVRHACELLGAENGTIGLLDEERRLIRTEAAYLMPPHELGAEMPPGVGLAGQVLRTQKSIRLDHYGDIARPTQPGLLQNAVIGVPIFWRGKLTGVFGLGSAPPRRFTMQDEEALTLFAKHAAVAIENARLFTDTQRALDEMQLLYETSRRINAAQDIDDVVAAYLQQVATRGRYACNVALYETDGKGNRTEIVVRGRWSPDSGMSLTGFRVPYTYDELDGPLDAGQTVLISDVFTDPRASETLRAVQRQSQRPALAMVPLPARGQRLGLVILSYPYIHDWKEADLRPYQATAAQLATALYGRRQQLLLYERAQQVAVLEERARLARDLHDSVTQLLFSITLIAQSVGAAWKRDPKEGEQRIQRVLELCQAAHSEMRALLTDLRDQPPQPPFALPMSGLAQLRESGLPDALRAHLATLPCEGLQIEFDYQGYASQSPEYEETLFRIAQEACNNVVKHAQADRVVIRLTVAGSTVQLAVQDNGVGFTPSSGRATKRGKQSSFGFQTMRERVEALGGTVTIAAAPGGGTTVQAIIPLKEGRHEP